MRIQNAVRLAVLLPLTACAPAEQAAEGSAARGGEALASPTVEYYASEQTLASGYPFADAVRVGDLLFLSGQIGVDPETFELVEGGIEAESRRTLDNVGRILAAKDLSFEDVVKCTVMLADIAEWPVFNTVYKEYFASGRYPARSAFAASGLALGARVEVECWAAIQ